MKPATYLSTKNDERVNIGIIQFVSLFNNHKRLDKGSFAKLAGRGLPSPLLLSKLKNTFVP